MNLRKGKIRGMQRFTAMFILLTMLLMMVLSGCGKEESVEASFVKDKSDLAKATIGVQLGTTGDIYASDEEEEGATVTRFNKGVDAVQALKKGKLDCVIIDEQPAKAFIANSASLSILDEAFVTEEYAICISKENQELKEKINAALAEIKENGTMDKIISNYIGDSTKGQNPYVSPDNVDRSNGQLVMATNAAFEPYEYVENNEIVGIDVDMAQALCDIMGMELKVEDIEFDAIINAVQSGKADIGVAGLTVTEDRLKSIDFSDSYATSTQVIIVRNGKSDGALNLKEKFYNNFIKDSRWKYLTNGLGATLVISFFAVIIGIVLGFLIAIGRSACDMTGKAKLLNWILKAYLTVIRGTPVMVQLLIIYYVVLASSTNKIAVATVAFGLNSAAYIAEIVRSGIMSVDAGQFEAGRSLGFNYSQTMWNFIMPQAFKNVLPALGNEFIVLLKETSISGYIGIRDLTRGGDLIRSRTFEAFLPLIAVAIIYLVIVIGLSSLVSRLEQKLKTDGR